MPGRPLVVPISAGFGASASTPAGECLDARLGTGDEPPVIGPQPHANHLERVFAFVDISGFTEFVDKAGEHAALEMLTLFRGSIRAVAARRGVRVGKWLGDGVMLVGVESAIVAAAVAEVFCRVEPRGIDLHAGIASGPVLLFEGDDYVGRPVNLSARLCDLASRGEVLAEIDPQKLPAWVTAQGPRTLDVAGVGDVGGLYRLAVEPEILAPFRGSAA